MTKSVGVHEAKTHLSQLLAAGEEVIITQRGEEVASLVPRGSSIRTLGMDRGRFVVPDDFDAPLSDKLLAEFERCVATPLIASS